MKRIATIICVLGAVVCGNLFGANPPYAQLLSLNYSAPTIVAYLTDSAGHRTGIDPDIPLNLVGQQLVSGTEHEIREIPASSCDQINLEGGQSTTGWEIGVEDPTGTYVFNYTSNNIVGADAVAIDLQRYSPRKLTPFNIYLLAQKNVNKQLQIAVSLAGITITPIVNSSDFLRDTQSACSLKDIAPESSCDKLEKLASSVEKALAKGDADDEREDLKNYLRVLNRLHGGEEKGERSDRHGEEGAKAFAKDPAYSALKLDAETLLKALPTDKEHGHDGDDSDHH